MPQNPPNRPEGRAELAKGPAGETHLLPRRCIPRLEAIREDPARLHPKAANPLRVVDERVPVPLKERDGLVARQLAGIDGVFLMPRQQIGEQTDVGGRHVSRLSL